MQERIQPVRIDNIKQKVHYFLFAKHNGHRYYLATMTKRDSPPIHPGEILLEDFLKPMGISQYRLAQSIHVPARRINEIVHGTRGITADTAIRLSRYFGTSAELWLGLQADYDLELARERLNGVEILALAA